MYNYMDYFPPIHRALSTQFTIVDFGERVQIFQYVHELGDKLVGFRTSNTI